MEKKARDATLDLLRFAATLLVMLHHCYLLVGSMNFPFNMAWVYVEFFLIITGYFTAKHFYSFDDDGEGSIVASLKYTFRKFRRIFFYSTVAIAVRYLIELLASRHTLLEFMDLLEHFICEATYITGASARDYYLAPVWYLCALFIVFPVFCMSLANKKTRLFFYAVFSWLFPVLFYGRYGVACFAVGGGYRSLERVLAGLYLGVLIFAICNYAREHGIHSKKKIGVAFAEVAAFLLPIILCYYNSESTLLMLICFVVCLYCVFCGESAIVIPSNWFTSWLGGELSLAMYLMHWNVYLLVGYYMGRMRIRNQILAGFVVTLLVCVPLTFIGKKWCQRRKCDIEQH